MLSLAIRKINALAQDLVHPSVEELGARLELGALELGLAHAAVPEPISLAGQGGCELFISESRFALPDRDRAAIHLLGDLIDERDSWIEDGAVLEKILCDAAAKEQA